MNATIANLINSISLIVIGLWGYFDVLSPTALIPVSIGAFLFFVQVVLKIIINNLSYSCTTHIININCISWHEIA